MMKFMLMKGEAYAHEWGKLMHINIGGLCLRREGRGSEPSSPPGYVADINYIII